MVLEHSCDEAFDGNRAANLHANVREATWAIENNNRAVGSDRQILEAHIVALDERTLHGDDRTFLKALHLNVGCSKRPSRGRQQRKQKC